MIDTTQSTAAILNANRLREQQAALATPDRITVDGGNPFSMMSSGINAIGQAISAPERRAIEQANLDRSNQQRIEAEEYERALRERAFQTGRDDRKENLALDAEREKYRRAQDGITNNARQRELQIQEAQLASKFYDAQVDDATGVITKELDTRRLAKQQELADTHKLAAIPNGFKLADELKEYTTAGSPSWDANLPPTVQEIMKQDTSGLAFSNMRDSVNKAITTAKKTAGSSWLPQYESFIINNWLKTASVSDENNWTEFSSGKLKSGELAKELVSKMANIKDVDAYNTDMTKYDAEDAKVRDAYMRDAQRAKLLNLSNNLGIKTPSFTVAPLK